MTAIVNALGAIQTNSPLTTQTYISATAGPPPIQQQVWAQWIGAEWLQQSTGICYKFFGNGNWVALSQSAASSPLTWVQVSSSQGSNPNFGYQIYAIGSPVVMTLPLTAAVGSFVVYDATTNSTTPSAFPGFTIAQNPGQQIFFGTSTHTTAGGTGSAIAPAQGMTIILVCTTANLIWNVQGTTGGSFIFN